MTDKKELLVGRRNWAMLGYNILIAFVFSGLLIYCVAILPYQPDSSQSAKPIPSINSQPIPTQATDLIPETEPKKSNSDQTGQTASSSQETKHPTPDIWLATMFTMVTAGGLGGVLRNFHGFLVHTYEDGGLPAELEQHYYLRPLTGAVLGLFTLFLGHLITSKPSDVAQLTWITPEGRMPYIGIALLAGFASAEFIGRMKAVAESLFQERKIPIRDQLRRLERLKDEELISEDMYEQKKKSIIDKFE